MARIPVQSFGHDLPKHRPNTTTQGKVQRTEEVNTTSNRSSLHNQDLQFVEQMFTDTNFQKVKRKLKRKGNTAAGIDGQSVENFLKIADEEKVTIRREIQNRTYKPLPSLEVGIPKPDSTEQRKLYIPTARDRLVQLLLIEIIEERIDRKFLDSSFAYRNGENRGCHPAVRKASQIIKEGNTVVVHLDIEKFFDSVNRKRCINFLFRMLPAENQNSILRYTLTEFVYAGYTTRRKRETTGERTEKGIPQGNPISPLLSNVYLHNLDRFIAKHRWKATRYADDVRVFFQARSEAEEAVKKIDHFLRSELKLQLNLNLDKTFIIDVKGPDHAVFLGFNLDGNGRITSTPKAQKNLLQRLDNPAKHLRKSKEELSPLQETKLLINGWCNYHAISEIIPENLTDVDKVINHRFPEVDQMAMKTWSFAHEKYRRKIGQKHLLTH